MKKQQSLIGLVARGMAMGAADVVPGVSGGTIAFITGIYDRFLDALKNAPVALKALFSDGIKAAWEKMDATFLCAVFAGILTSILSFAHLISYLLATYPVMLWSFFFGLILVSGVHMLKQIGYWGAGNIALLLLGIAVSYGIGLMTPAHVSPGLGVFFMAGAIAICAMILPGVSGSFILLLMGLYSALMEAVKSFDILVMAVFGSGCLVGLLSFSHVLSWLLKHYRDLTVSLLTGLMIGALGKVWPWKHTLETRINSSGEKIPLIETNISPFAYEQITQQPPYLLESLGLMLAAITLVLVMERFGREKG